MKKLALLVSVIMVAALALPAMAADLQLKGSMESSVVWRQQNWLDDQNQVEEPAGLSADTTLKLNAGIGTPESGVRAGIELSPPDETRLFGTQSNLKSLSVTKAFVEVFGQLWQNGPSTVARLGSLDVGYSPYVATFDREGFSLSGLGFGPVSVSGFVSGDADPIDPANPSAGYNPPFSVAGAQVRAEMLGVTGLGTILDVNGVRSYEIAAGAMPLPGMAMTAVYATDGEHAAAGRPATMTRVGAQAMVLPNLSVGAEYRKVHDTFNPRYQKIEKDANGERIDWLYQNQGEQGVLVGVKTRQFGVDVEASLDNYQLWLDENRQPVATPTLHRDGSLAAATTLAGFEVGAASDFDLASGFVRKETTLSAAYPMAMQGLSVTPGYTATIDEAGGVAHEISAKATIDMVPQLPGMGIEGRVKRAADGAISYGADLNYTAPNGLAIGVHHDSAKGAWVDAGLKAEF